MFPSSAERSCIEITFLMEGNGNMVTMKEAPAEGLHYYMLDKIKIIVLFDKGFLLTISARVTCSSHEI